MYRKPLVIITCKLPEAAWKPACAELFDARLNP